MLGICVYVLAKGRLRTEDSLNPVSHEYHKHVSNRSLGPTATYSQSNINLKLFLKSVVPLQTPRKLKKC